MRRSATDILPASAFLTAGVADTNRVNMSMAKLLPFKQVTFLIPLALIYKFSFQFFTGAMEVLVVVAIAVYAAVVMIY